MDNCQVCIVIQRDGWNSTEWVHCNNCCAKWTGAGRAHCNLCHQTFNSDGAATLHWTKEWGHAHPVNMDNFSLRNGIWYLNYEWTPSVIWEK